MDLSPPLSSADEDPSTTVSSITSHEVLFRDIDEAIDEAADTVCNGGLDVGAVVVEVDDDHDVEERRVARFLSSGCNCQQRDGMPCSSAFSAPQLQAFRDECQ